MAISNTPAPRSLITPTSTSTSLHDASRLATGRSSDVAWLTERDVVNPIAPARIDASTSRRMAARSSSVASSSNARSPIT